MGCTRPVSRNMPFTEPIKKKKGKKGIWNCKKPKWATLIYRTAKWTGWPCRWRAAVTDDCQAGGPLRGTVLQCSSLIRHTRETSSHEKGRNPGLSSIQISLSTVGPKDLITEAKMLAWLHRACMAHNMHLYSLGMVSPGPADCCVEASQQVPAWKEPKATSQAACDR